LRIHTLWRGTPYLHGPVCAVQLLGSSSLLSFSQREDGLYIKLPQSKPDEPAFTFRIAELATQSNRCGN